MAYKVLTVDDSKTVRIIVKKAFKPFDCEIVEAANGVEGLAAAAKEMPSLILLDITMPVMDGVEMLTKLKSDPMLKGIPVIMLTAEGGRDNVLKIAKIGVRDYIVKPFKEDVLIEKVGRIIELKPLSDGAQKAKTIFDPATILVVDDKPAIVQQIQEGLKHTPWKIHGVSTQGEAIDFVGKNVPDLMIVSLSLPESGAMNVFRLTRQNPKLKYTPIFGLVVKTDVEAQQQAQQVGFSYMVTKPLDLADLESKISKAMNLDTSLRFYAIDGDCFVMRMPDQVSEIVIAEAAGYFKTKVSDAVNGGIGKAVIDLQAVKGLNMGLIKLLLQSMQTFKDLGMRYAMVGNPTLVSECKGFEDTARWQFSDSMAEAKDSLAKGAAVAV